jgi:catechol 2,3-dioxygenase-like lactoylglutathione lyase family enzyme
MLGSESLMAFLATTNPARAKSFYEQTLGLRLIADEEHALVFDAHGTMLRIQKVQKFGPAQHTALGWHVPDIARAVAELQAKNILFERYPFMEQDASGIWNAPGGAKVAWFKDPDGNLLSLTEMEMLEPVHGC